MSARHPTARTSRRCSPPRGAPGIAFSARDLFRFPSIELLAANEGLEERGRALIDSQARLQSHQAELEQTNTQLEEYAQRLERQKAELVSAQQSLSAN
ncbi:hypothetical protein PPH41_34570, partial [Burkholderia gladioli]|nr:hypothetical protein [Burkholderia gladioli]